MADKSFNLQNFPLRAPSKDIVSVTDVKNAGLPKGALGGWAPQLHTAIVPSGDTRLERAVRMHEAAHVSFQFQPDLKTQDIIAQIMEDCYIHHKLGKLDGSAARDERTLAANQLHGRKADNPTDTLLMLRSAAIASKYKPSPILDYIGRRLTRQQKDLFSLALKAIYEGRAVQARRLIMELLKQESKAKSLESEEKEADKAPSPSKPAEPRPSEPSTGQSSSPSGSSSEPVESESEPVSGGSGTEGGSGRVEASLGTAEPKPVPATPKKSNTEITRELKARAADIRFRPSDKGLPKSESTRDTAQTRREELEGIFKEVAERLRIHGICSRTVTCAADGHVTMDIYQNGPWVTQYSAARDRGAKQYEPSPTGSRIRHSTLAEIACGSSAYPCRKRVRGMSILVDMSSSMSLNVEQVRGVLAQYPASIVAYYNAETDSPFGGQGQLVVCAKSGMVLKQPWIFTSECSAFWRMHTGLPPLPKRFTDKYGSCGANLVDYPAIKWLLAQRAPRILITDLVFTGPLWRMALELTQKSVREGAIRLYKSFSEFMADKRLASR